MMIKTRNEIDEKYKWQLEDLFKTDKDWNITFLEIEKSIPEIEKFRGQLGSFEKLETAFDLILKLEQKLGMIYVYANMRLHEDTQNCYYQEMADKSNVLKVKFNSVNSFFAPELLSLSDDYLKDFAKKNNIYKHYIYNLIRSKDHVLDFNSEKILADASDIADSFENIFVMINNADIKFKNVIDNDNKEYLLSHANYLSLLENPERNIREQAYNNYYEAYLYNKNVLATLFNSSVKSNLFFSKNRKFSSVLAANLFGDNIPEYLYKKLIFKVNNNIKNLHEYLNFKKEKLGLEKMNFFDLYAPIFEDVKLEINYDKAKEIIIESLQPLGKNYIEQISTAFDNRWIDIYENKNKRCGAYSWGAYGCHPYVLLNYNNNLNGVLTIAHELGHAVHSFYSWSTQNFLYSSYTIFLAEIASTVNEILLIEHLLKKYQEDTKMQNYLIDHFCEEFRRTVYRQTMFAEFELNSHTKIEDGESLTLEHLNKIYSELNKKYYGEILEHNDKSDFEWARIPHFYNCYYVYQYATGFSIACNFAYRILSGETEFYLDFLKSGSKDYTSEIIKKTGLDLEKPDFIDYALSKFNDLVNKLKTN